MRLDELLERLEGVKRSASGFVARCPAHDDHRQSLSIGEGDNGCILLTCFAGCETADVMAALGLGLADLYPCLLYTSDAADALLCVDLGGRRILTHNNR